MEKAPETLQEAIARGFQVHDVEAGLTGKPMAPDLNCTPGTEGHKCATGPCMNNEQRIYYCSGGACTKYISYGC